MASAWVEQIFGAKALTQGKPVRRQIESVKKFSSQAELQTECDKRGLILMMTPSSYVIYPKGSFEILTA